MRNLFLVLVLVNLAFAAWSAWFTPSAHRGRPADEGLPALTLVSEVPADLLNGVALQSSEAAGADAEPPASTESGVAAEPDGAAAAGEQAVAATAGEQAVAAPDEVEAPCTSVGPFRELSQAAAAAGTLRGAGYDPQQRVVEGDVWIG